MAQRTRGGAAAIVGAWLSVVGCGGSTSAREEGSGVSLESLPQRVAELTCRKLFECCSVDQLSVDGMLLFPDESSCRATYVDALSPELDLVKESIENGRATYDGDAAAACFAKLERTSCQVLTSEVPLPCGYFTGLLHDGESCAASGECISGLCDLNSFTPTCIPVPKLGESCSGICEDGTVCNLDFVCSLPKKVGDSCTFSFECETTRCRSGVCVPDSICPR